MRRIALLLMIMWPVTACASSTGNVYHGVTVVDDYGELALTEVYIYKPNTTTEATIYADRAETLAITQPMTTSSTNTTLNNGFFSWYGPDGYDYKIKTAYRTQDNYQSASLNASITQITMPGTLALDNELYAIASITPAANKMGYWSDPNTFTLFSTTAVARAFLTDPNGIADSNYIGLDDGSTYSAFGDGNDVDLNQLFAAVDTAVGALAGGHDPVTVVDTNTIDFTLSTQQITADANESGLEAILDLSDLQGTLGLSQLATTGSWTPTATLDLSGATVTFGLEVTDLPDANLVAIAGLTTAANKLNYWTGAGTTSLTDLTAYARTMLDDANAAAVRTTLGMTSFWQTRATSDANAVEARTGLVAERDHWYNIKDYGGVGDGSEDDSAAFTAAIAAMSAGETLYLPRGQYRIASGLTMAVAKPFNMIGDGSYSCIVPDVGTDANAITIGDGSDYVYNFHWADFSIMADANSCKTAMIVNRAVGATFKNIQIVAGGTDYAIRPYGTIGCTWDSCGNGGTETGYTYAREPNFFRAERYPGLDYFNNNRVHLRVSVTSGTAFYAQEFEGLDLSGVYENADSDNDDDDGEPEIYIYGGTSLHAHDIYTESIYGDTRGKIVLDSTNQANLESVFGNGGTCIIKGQCNQVTLGPGSWWYNLTIGEECSGTTVGPGVYLGAASGGYTVTDNGIGTTWIAPIYWAPHGKSDPNEYPLSVAFEASDYINLIGNSNFHRWSSGVPVGWAASIGGTGTTLAHAGTGQTDTTTHHGQDCLKWSQTGSGGYIYYTLDETTEDKVLGQTITASMWINQSSGTPTANTPSIYLKATGSAEGTKTGAASSVPVDVDTTGWQRHFCTLTVPLDATAVTLYLTGGGTSVVTYAAQPFVGIGLVGQRGYIPTRNEFDRIALKTVTLDATGPTDDLDVSGVGVVLIDTDINSVTLGGMTGGIEGQPLTIAVIDANNTTKLEHAEGTGNQDIYLSSSGDETRAGEYAVWNLVCGSDLNWYATPTTGDGDMLVATYDVLDNGYVDGNDTVYNSTSWNNNPDAPSMGAIRNKIEALPGGHDPVTVADTNTVDLTLSTQLLSAEVLYQDTNSIDIGEDASGLKATLLYQQSTTATLSVDASGLKVDVNDTYYDTQYQGLDSTLTEYAAMPDAGTDPDVDAAGEIGRDTDDDSLRGFDGTYQFVYGQRHRKWSIYICDPNSWDSTYIHAPTPNDTGFTFVIESIRAEADVDNVVITLLEMNDPNDRSDTTTIEAVTIDGNGTSVYYKNVNSGIDHTNIETTHSIGFQNSGDDDPNWVRVICNGRLDANVD